MLLDPLVMFSSQLADLMVNFHGFYRYYPCVFNTKCARTDTTYKIQKNQLNAWSLGGHNADQAGRGATPTGNFWAVQTPTPAAMVEWPVSMYVLNKNDQPLASNDLTTYVFQLFANDPYVPPNCVINGSTAQCDYSTR